MTAVLEAFVGLARPQDRAATSRVLARHLGGEQLIVFVRDEAVDRLLPAEGHPQTLPGSRAWRRFVDECVDRGECATDALASPDGGTVPAYGFSNGPDVVAVVLGTRARSAAVDELRALLPLLAATVHGERAARAADAQTRLAQQSVAHAEELASALERVRGQLQRALVEAERAREELEQANLLLLDQVAEAEAQAVELETQAEELQQTNQALEDARKEAEEANKAKAQFLATMSHELRTPLNAIAGHLQLVQMGIHGPVTERQSKALDRINRSQQHLLGIINNILNFARVESGHMEYRSAPLRLAEAAADLEDMIQPQFTAKGLHYEMRVDGSLAVIADREKLQQILLNLLSNAVKFTPSGGRVALEARVGVADPGRVEVSVSDTGTGIAPEKLAVIFEPFVQVDSSHSRSQQGTGLGLAISRELARGMGGDLHVESMVGRGSTFTLDLAIADTALIAAPSLGTEMGGGSLHVRPLTPPVTLRPGRILSMVDPSCVSAPRASQAEAL